MAEVSERPALMRSEWVKLVSIRAHVVSVGGGLGVLFLVMVAYGLFGREASRNEYLTVVTGFGVLAALLTACVATLGVTAEFGYHTARTTFAATPSRPRVLLAKAMLSGAIGFAVGVIAVIGALALSMPLLAWRGIAPDLTSGSDAVLVLAGLPVFSAALAVFGCGLGLLIRSTPNAVSALVIWPFVIERLVSELLALLGLERADGLMPYLSGYRLVSSEELDSVARLSGGLYFVVFAATCVGLGISVNERRDT